MTRSAFGDRRLVARAGFALLLANVRYWTTVAPVVRAELRRWEERAQAIEDTDLRELALEKLRGEGFHAEAAAMLATLAPRARRKDAVEAIVALELLFDYLDGLTERPSEDPLRDGERLFAAYRDAVTAGSQSNGSAPSTALEQLAGDENPLIHDGGYLQALSSAANEALERLPAAGAITVVARKSAARSIQAQVRMHASSVIGAEQLEQWARTETDGTGLEWRELLAGAASSVLAVHALIAAAADPATTHEEAIEIEAAYLSTCVLLTLLDGVVDHSVDTHAVNGHEPARLGYAGLYENDDHLSGALTDAIARAARQTRTLRCGPHHAMTLAGVVAYYTSAPGARSELAEPIATRLRRELRPLISPALALMRIWRLAKRLRNRRSLSLEGLT